MCVCANVCVCNFVCVRASARVYVCIAAISATTYSGLHRAGGVLRRAYNRRVIPVYTRYMRTHLCTRPGRVHDHVDCVRDIAYIASGAQCVRVRGVHVHVRLRVHSPVCVCARACCVPE